MALSKLCLCDFGHSLPLRVEGTIRGYDLQFVTMVRSVKGGNSDVEAGVGMLKREELRAL